MNYLEARLFRQGYHIPPTTCSVGSVPCQPTQIAPQVNPAGLVKQQPPITDESFNHLTADDLQILHECRGMDDFHRNDALAVRLNKGRKMTEFVKSHGAREFVSRYGYDLKPVK